MKKALVILFVFSFCHSCKKCYLCEGYLNGRWYGEQVCTKEKNITKKPVMMVKDDNGNVHPIELDCH